MSNSKSTDTQFPNKNADDVNDIQYELKDLDSARSVQRKNNYIFLLILQLFTHFNSQIIYLIAEDKNSSIIQTSFVLHMCCIITTNLVLYRITANFHKNKYVRIGFALIIIIQFAIGGFVNTQAGVKISELVTLGILANISSCICFGFIFYLLLKDIFLYKHDLTYSLLGASNLYLLIPVIFGFAYYVLAMINPTYFQLPDDNIMLVVRTTFNYSFYISAGIDYPGSTVGMPVSNLAILQSFLVSLFIVFIVGRLMINEKKN